MINDLIFSGETWRISSSCAAAQPSDANLAKDSGDETEKIKHQRTDEKKKNPLGNGTASESNEREISIKHRRTGLEGVLPHPLLSFHTLPPALLSRPGVYPHLIGRRPSHAHLHGANSPPCSALLVFTAPLLPALALPYLFISPTPPSPPFLHLRYQRPPPPSPLPSLPQAFCF